MGFLPGRLTTIRRWGTPKGSTSLFFEFSEWATRPHASRAKPLSVCPKGCSVAATLYVNPLLLYQHVRFTIYTSIKKGAKPSAQPLRLNRPPLSFTMHEPGAPLAWGKREVSTMETEVAVGYIPTTPAAVLQFAAVRCLRARTPSDQQATEAELQQEANQLKALRPKLTVAERQKIRNELQGVVMTLTRPAADRPEILDVLRSAHQHYA